MKLNKLLLFFLLSASLPAGSNAQNWLWKAGSEGNDAATATATDVSGNIYTTGYFSADIDFEGTLFNTSGQSDIFLTRHDSSGNLDWAVKAGGTYHDKALSVACDALGNSYVTGVYKGTAIFGNITLNSVNNSQDIFLAKYSSTGTLDWVKSAGGPQTDISSAVTVDFDGNVYITGQFKATAFFGSVSRTSIPDSTGSPTYDIFIAKYNTSGALQWLKQGGSDYDDRGMSISCDGDLSIYTTGQFSDTLYFGNTYFNTGYNAGYLLKMDLDGNEQWFKRFIAGVITCNDVSATDPDRIYVTGDFSGTLMVAGPPYESTTSSWSKKIFLAQFNPAGQLIWLENDGSDNEFSSRSVCTDASGNAYITGNFKCVLNEYSELYGPGVFNSIGYNDVFTAKYSPQGIREWERHFGSAGEDRGWGIEPGTEDNPVICGSFSRRFNVPASPAFDIIPGSSQLSGPNASGMDYCSDTDYGLFVSVFAEGQADIFLSKPVDLARQPYDFYERTGGTCNRDIVPAEIAGLPNIIVCDSAYVTVNTHTGATGPDFVIAWETGDSTGGTWIAETGWYSVTMAHADGCRSYADSIFVEAVPTPVAPVAVSDYGTIIPALPEGGCINKLIMMQGDTAHFSISNMPSLPGYTWYWQRPSGAIVHNSQIAASAPGIYTFHLAAYSLPACEATTCINVVLLTPADTMPLDLSGQGIMLSTGYDSDTVKLCNQNSFTVEVTDSNGILIPIPAFGVWSATTPPVDTLETTDTTFIYHSIDFEASGSGWTTITVNFFTPLTLAPIGSLSRTIYIDYLSFNPPGPLISGPQFICPGDTVMVTIQYQGELTSVNAPSAIYISPGMDTLLFDGEGSVTAFGTDTNIVYLCSGIIASSYHLQLKPPPLISMAPADGIICPSDSVMLTTPPALSYKWLGPDGDTISQTQTTYAHSPGLYQCQTVDPDGCSMVSEPVEVREYSTPFIDSDGTISLCPGEDAIISVITLPEAVISWAPPLSGSDLTVYVSQPGTYSCTVTLCGIVTPLSVVVELISLNPVINILGPNSLCAGQSTTLSTVPDMAFYNWSNGAEETNTVVIATPGSYTVNITDPNGCVFTTPPVTITAGGIPPAVPVTSNDTTICAGESVLVTAQSGTTVFWYTDPVIPTHFATGAQVSTGPISESLTWFAASFYQGCYSERIPVNVNVSPASFPPVITGDTTVCIGDALHLGTIEYVGMSYSWTGPGSFTSQQPEIIIGPADVEQGMYSLAITDGICNSPVTSVSVNVSALPPALLSASGPPEACSGDSILLIANPGLTGYTWINTVQDDDSLWVTATGDYWVEVSNDAGCSSISDTLAISFTLFPTIIAPSDTGGCYLQSIQLTAASNATVYWYLSDTALLPVDSGSTFTLHLQFNDTVLYVAGANPYCSSAREPVQILASSFAFLPVISGDSMLCIGDNLLLSTPYAPGVLYTWTGPEGDTISATSQFAFNDISEDEEGFYHLTVSDGVCYIDAGNREVMVHPLPVAGIDTTGPISLCDGDSVLLVSSGGGAGYDWLPGHLPDTNLAVYQSGNYAVIVTTMYGCSDTSEVIQVTVNPLPLSPTGFDTIVCQDTPFDLNVPGGGSIGWFTSDSTFLFNGNTYSSAGINTPLLLYLWLTDANGCHSSYAVADIDVNALADTFSIGGDDTLCVSGSFTLSVNEAFPGASYTWHTPSGPTGNTDTLYINDAQLSDSGLYVLELNFDGCSVETDAYTVNVVETWWAPEIPGSDTACFGESIILSTNPISGAEYTWHTPLNVQISGPGIGIDTVQNSDTGTYILSYSLAGCLSDTAELYLMVGYIPQPNAGSDTTTCAGTPIVLQLDSVFSTISWNNSFTDPVIEVTDSGLYVAYVTNSYGCSNSDSIYVTLEDCGFIAPNILTPNGDGLNDTFSVNEYNMQSIQVSIYDRWGILMSRWSELALSWDGTNMRSGQPVPDGTYYYVMEGVNIDNNPAQHAGFIQLLR